MSSQLSTSTESNSLGSEKGSILLWQLRQTSTQQKQCCYWVSRVRSKGAILVLIWTLLTAGSYFSAIELSTQGLPTFMSEFPMVVSAIILALCCPIASWLADAYFGRYKLMCVGLWIMWVGNLVIGLAQITELEVPNVSKPLHHSTVVIATVVLTIGFAVFIVNLIPFGTDQMPEASGKEMSTFIHWLVCVLYAGGTIALLGNLISSCSSLPSVTTHAFQSLIPVTLSSLALCCNLVFHEWLIKEPVRQNPVKTILGVVKFAAKHKHPIRRSALTYCEDETPSRIDFAKSKYGGPFAIEKVEDVKTFLRIVVVIVSTCALLLPIFLYTFSASLLQSQSPHLSSLSTCSEAITQLSYSKSLIIVLSIPLYEVLIHPLTKQWIPSTLKRLCISAVFTVFLSLIMLSIVTVSHLHGDSTSCIFTNISSSMPVNYTYVAIPSNILLGIQSMMFIIALFEFICAQTPNAMKGILFGTVYGTSFTVPIAYIVFVIWIHTWKSSTEKLNCGFWYYLFTTLTAVVGLVIICVVAKWYKRRERKDPLNEHIFAEDYYDQHFSQHNRQNLFN